jgi:hypothetical protein
MISWPRSTSRQPVLHSRSAGDAEWQFLWPDQFRLKALYPSRRFKMPFYPFLNGIYREIPTYVYSLNGNKIASYIDRSALLGLGWGFLYKNYWNIETELDYEIVNIKPDIAPEEGLKYFDWQMKSTKSICRPISISGQCLFSPERRSGACRLRTHD